MTGARGWRQGLHVRIARGVELGGAERLLLGEVLEALLRLDHGFRYQPAAGHEADHAQMGGGAGGGCHRWSRWVSAIQSLTCLGTSTATIAGPRTASQMKDTLGVFKHEWSADDEALIDGLVAPGHPSTPGTNDPGYPLEGRPIG